MYVILRSGKRGWGMWNASCWLASIAGMWSIRSVHRATEQKKVPTTIFILIMFGELLDRYRDGMNVASNNEL